MVAEVDRDAGFCSGEDEEDIDTDLHSPTDISEDSVDVKVKPITNLIAGSKSKRKFGEEIKRRLLDFRNVSEGECSPFRPWSHKTPPGYIPRGYQDEPLSLVLREKHSVLERLAPNSGTLNGVDSRPQDVVRLRKSTCGLIPVKPEEFSNPYIGRVEELEDPSDKRIAYSVESLISNRPVSPLSTPSTSIVDDKRKSSSVHSQQRNYKNMTRERRIEANARERTRVHTISAAFDTLRRAVPAYSHNQKLSKLSVLRIACSYILTLSRVAGNDYSEDNSHPPLAECVDNVSRTIQLEGKLRKKKDD